MALASRLSASARDESSSDKSARNYAERASAINDGMGRNVANPESGKQGKSYSARKAEHEMHARRRLLATTHMKSKAIPPAVLDWPKERKVWFSHPIDPS